MKNLTSSQLSVELAAVGHPISSDVIKKDWQKGAPRTSAEDYLAWRGRRAEKTGRGDPELRRLRGAKLEQEIELLKQRKVAQERENKAEAGELIRRNWMAERIHVAASKITGFRIRSEAEHPLLFSAADRDVPSCRMVVCKIWDEILTAMNGLSRDFDEDNPLLRDRIGPVLAKWRTDTSCAGLLADLDAVLEDHDGPRSAESTKN